MLRLKLRFRLRKSIPNVKVLFFLNLILTLNLVLNFNPVMINLRLLRKYHE